MSISVVSKLDKNINVRHSTFLIDLSHYVANSRITQGSNVILLVIFSFTNDMSHLFSCDNLLE